jgi:hypothetical protein
MYALITEMVARAMEAVAVPVGTNPMREVKSNGIRRTQKPEFGETP